jgi:hypothetical protein
LSFLKRPDSLLFKVRAEKAKQTPKKVWGAADEGGSEYSTRKGVHSHAPEFGLNLGAEKGD